MHYTNWLPLALLAAFVAVVVLLAFIGWKYPDTRSADERMEDVW